ncbi:MAG: hypothetical protein IKE36_12215 [Solobacterium sp.]|nr:hypothetical protein [Solobacterium sp.]
MKDKKFATFSVPLGLLDYVNPVLYTVTMVTVIRNTYEIMDKPYNTILLIGAIISIFFGLIIPTGKVLVGLGVIKFVMPVSLVFCVNTGILISGLMLFRQVMRLGNVVLMILTALIVVLLGMLYTKSKKINTIAVLTGAAGYLLIYTSLITLSVQKGKMIPVMLYALAILLFIMLCGIGIKADLKDPKVHWVIEISNVLCQLFVAVATVVLFAG